jgi:hypothetical protein
MKARTASDVTDVARPNVPDSHEPSGLCDDLR